MLDVGSGPQPMRPGTAAFALPCDDGAAWVVPVLLIGLMLVAGVAVVAVRRSKTSGTAGSDRQGPEID